MINNLKTQIYNNETEIQNMIYDIGNKYKFDLKEWFGCLYQTLLGTKTGPRFGTFIWIFGVKNTISLVMAVGFEG